MTKLLPILFMSILLSGEMEVDGDLKVTGTVDANGNPITNVGAALSMTDAINGNVLQSALRDDGTYEYIVFFVYMYIVNTADAPSIQKSGYMRLDQDNFEGSLWGDPMNSMSSFNTNITTLMNEGWKLDSINGGGSAGGDGGGTSWWIFKRPVSDD